MRLDNATARLRTLIGGALQRKHGSFIFSAAAVQALPLISAPVIARLYTPEAFGAYAIFYALVAVISASASLALHNAILLEDEDAPAARAALLSLSVAVVISCLTAALVHGVPKSALQWALGTPVMSILVWLPATVFLGAAYVAVYTWFIRQGHYNLLARNKVILGISTLVIQISIGMMRLEAIGFVMANLLGYLIAIGMLVRRFESDVNGAHADFTITSAIKLFKKHRNLSLYTVPATLINTVSSQIPELMINKIFGAQVLGQYSLANRMVNLPLSFVASSVQDIFRQKASAENNESGTCRKTFKAFFVLQALLAVVFLTPVVLLMPLVFPIIFGEQWGQSGYLIRAMLFLLAVRFVSSPLSYVWIIKGRQRMDMYWQLGLLIVSAVAFLLPQHLGIELSLIGTLYVFSAMTGLWYVMCILYSHKYANQ